MKRLGFLLCFSLLSIVVFAQKTDDDLLQEIVQLNNDVEINISKGVYHRHLIDLNSDKKDWSGAKNYNEQINCYFEIKEDGEVRLVKIVNVLQKDNEKAVQNYLFGDTEQILMSYTDYFRGEERLGQQAAYFGDKNIVATSINDKVFIGDNLTDEMVKTARNAYLKARKYKQMFITLLSIQLSK
ncbi:MAG: hypothetical protein ACPG19_10210 [Saprospiraceae bacterium]